VGNPVTEVKPPAGSGEGGVNPLSWVPLNGRCEWFDDGKDKQGCEPNAQDLQRKADELEANIKKSTGLSAQERAALEFELVKTLAWRVDLLNPGGTGPTARASIWAIVESPAYDNLSPERKLAFWQVISYGLQTGKMGRADLGQVAGGMWGLSQNKSVLAAYPELRNKNLGAGFMPSGGTDGLAALGLGVTAMAGGTLQLGLSGSASAGLVATVNPAVLAILVIAAGAYMVLSSDIGQDVIRNIGGIWQSADVDATVAKGGEVVVASETTEKNPCGDPDGGGTKNRWHHTVPRAVLKILEQLSPGISDDPRITPNPQGGTVQQWPLSPEMHKRVHSAQRYYGSGGAYNYRFKERITDFVKTNGRPPTVDEVLEMRDDLAKTFGFDPCDPSKGIK
jgi:hypothetical protein